MLDALLLAAAMAGSTPLVEVHANSLSALSDRGGTPGAGGGVAIGVNGFGPLWVEGVVDADWTPAAPLRLAIWPRVRVFATPRDDGHRAALSFAAGAGLQILPTESRGQFDLSTALDVRMGKALALRFEGGWAPTTTTLGVTRLALGLAWTPHRAPPAPAPAEHQVWLPYAECRWSSESEAAAYVAGTAQHVAGDVQVADLAAEAAAVPPHAPPAVVMAPGTTVPTPIPPWKDHVIFVRGNVASVRILFARGDATVDDTGRALLAPLGVVQGFVWHVHGSYSLEGDVDQNRALALARASAVRDVLLSLLVASGAPPTVPISVDVAEPSPGAAPEDQRTATVDAEYPEDAP